MDRPPAACDSVEKGGRGLVTHIETFLLVGETWVPNGTLTVTGDLNANDRIFTAHASLQVRDSAFGDFEGIPTSAPGCRTNRLGPSPRSWASRSP